LQFQLLVIFRSAHSFSRADFSPVCILNLADTGGGVNCALALPTPEVCEDTQARLRWLPIT